MTFSVGATIIVGGELVIHLHYISTIFNILALVLVNKSDLAIFQVENCS